MIKILKKRSGLTPLRDDQGNTSNTPLMLSKKDKGCYTEFSSNKKRLPKGNLSLTGFTLVELLLSIGILIVALSGLLHMFNYCLTLTEQSVNLVTATAEAHGKLEEIRRHNYNNIVDDYNNTTFTLSQLSGSGAISASYVSGTSSELIQTSVTLTYTEKGGRQATFILTTLIADKF